MCIKLFILYNIFKLSYKLYFYSKNEFSMLCKILKNCQKQRPRGMECVAFCVRIDRKVMQSHS